VPPYFKVSGYYAKPFGLNTVGLQRRGFAEETIADLRRAYKIIYRNSLTVMKAIEELQRMGRPEIAHLIEFIESSNAGIVR
jgi:UDP-N-acetylglucosamine acyltransferase